MTPVSVIIPTYNGASKIGALLESLQRQSNKNFQVVIVIDGSTDETLEVLKNYQSNFIELKIINQNNQGRAVAKNTGAENANGDLLIFYDDDMRPSTTSVQSHVDFYNSNNCEYILGGNQIEDKAKAKNDIENYKAHLTYKWLSKYHEGVNYINEGNLFLTAANFSISRNLFKKLNGFNSKLTDAEDFDLAFRAVKQKVKIYFDKSNLAIHEDPITCKRYIIRQRQYSLARKNLLYLKNTYLDKNNPSTYLKKMIYRIFADPFLVDLIDRDFFRIVPKKIKYKFYDITIHALAVEYPDIKL
jgi:glycosyltransferase involved in cell wall biosynthesis